MSHLVCRRPQPLVLGLTPFHAEPVVFIYLVHGAYLSYPESSMHTYRCINWPTHTPGREGA